MKKMVVALIAFLIMGTLSAEEFIEKDMLGKAKAFKTWTRHERARFNKGEGPDGKNAVTISAAIGGGPFVLSKSFNDRLEKLKGRKVALYGMVKAYNVPKGEKHWFGIKFQVTYKQKGVEGTRYIEADGPRHGAFDWKEYEVVVDLPEDLSAFNINIGLLGTGGKIQISDVDLKLAE